MKFDRLVGAAVVAAAVALAAGPAPVRAGLTAEGTRLNIESFEYIWRTIRDQHFDPTLGGLDWQAVRAELRPTVERAETKQEARAAMREMIGRLRQSHFNIIASEAYANIDSPAKKGDVGGTTGIEIRVIDGEAVVVGAPPGTPGGDAGVRPGWIVRRIDDADIPSLLPSIEKEFEGNPRKDLYLARSVIGRLHGAIGDTLRVSFLDERDRPVERILALAEEPGKKIVFGNFPPFYLRTEAKTLDGRIGYFSFSVFFDPLTLMPEYESAMRSFMDAPGVVIDIRGNPGGIGAIPIGMAGWFIDEKNRDIGTMRTRDNTLRFVVNPRARVYRGPVAILVDGLSGSSSEIFAGGVQGYPRVKIIGERTIGATLPSIAERLPNGDGFQYATASYIARDGSELEGTGVVPDIEARLTREALLAGRDPALEAAIDWIGSQEYNGGK
jgi:carboxyl-terminal processing protease